MKKELEPLAPGGGQSRDVGKGLRSAFFSQPISAGAQSSRHAATSVKEELYCGYGEMGSQAEMDCEEDRPGEARRSRIEAGSKKPRRRFWAESVRPRGRVFTPLRLRFSAIAHLLISVLRAEVMWGRELAKATVGQIRLKLLKVAMGTEVSCRRIHLELASEYPYCKTFARAWAKLSAMSTA